MVRNKLHQVGHVTSTGFRGRTYALQTAYLKAVGTRKILKSVMCRYENTRIFRNFGTPFFDILVRFV